LFFFVGIPVKIHEKHGIYVPELIFGHLLTGSNFDDTEQKVTGGRNGLGAKLANIYSLQFTVETASGFISTKKKSINPNPLLTKMHTLIEGFSDKITLNFTFQVNTGRNSQ
jgi:DNA topoisomerase-2